MPSVETEYSDAHASSRPGGRLGMLQDLVARLPLPPVVWRVARFGSVGLVGLGVDAGIFSLLYGQGSSAPVARAASLLVGTVVTWFLNRTFTFAPSGHKALHEVLRYALVALLAQGFNYVSFLVLLHWTGGTHPLRVLVATAVMTAGFSFTGQSLFAFGRGAMRPLISKR